jgi:hypothetical protein
MLNYYRFFLRSCLNYIFWGIIGNASVRSVFKDFVRISLPSLAERCKKEPPEDVSRSCVVFPLKPT